MTIIASGLIVIKLDSSEKIISDLLYDTFGRDQLVLSLSDNDSSKVTDFSISFDSSRNTTVDTVFSSLSSMLDKIEDEDIIKWLRITITDGEKIEEIVIGDD